MLDLTYETPTPKRIAGAKDDWELVIGMEVHAQVSSNAKLFSGASTTFGAEPNNNVAFVDAAMPGMLPVINEYCVEQAVRTGLGLKAEINLKSAFDRKNYFYPDLPQGYQISQLYEPIVGEGEVLVEIGDGTARLVRIERIHMEQDAGKSIHDMDPNMSFVDLNRTGVCLMEIVSRPDIRGPEEAAAYLGKLRQILRYLGTCNGDMQSGAMRADVNVSICRPGQYEKYQETQDFAHLGTRCEIKNMNSMRFIQQAIEVEARRQIAIVEGGGEVVQETRLFDPDKQETRSMRSKEEAHDYRYFPDPDLLPLEIEQAWVDQIAATLPELPDAKKARFINDFGLSDYDASVLTADLDSSGYFEEVAKGRDGKMAANWVINELFGRLKKDECDITDSPVSPAQLGGVIDLIASDAISGKIAKDLFEIVYTDGGDPAQIVEERGMKQVTDTGAIEAAVDEIIAANPDQVAKAQENPKLAGWFVGQVMKATGGKANPKAVNQLVAQKLKGKGVAHTSSLKTVLPEWIDFNGHMNMAYYNVLFDTAVDEVYDEIGFGPAYQKTGFTTYVAEFHVCYLQELKLDDQVRVSFQVVDFDEKRIHTYQEIWHEDGWCAATAEGMVLHVDQSGPRVAAMPQHILEQVKRHKAAPGDLPDSARIGRRIGLKR